MRVNAMSEAVRQPERGWFENSGTLYEFLKGNLAGRRALNQYSVPEFYVQN